MKKKILVLFSCLFVFSLVFVSCKDSKKKDNEKVIEEIKDTEEEMDEDSENYTKNIISENEEQYPISDIEIFEDKDFSKRVKDLVGEDKYEEIIDNFNTETPIVAEDHIYKFTGCKEHACPEFHTKIYYDAVNDNLNVIVDRDGEVKVYDEDGKIKVTKSLEAK